jgi:hypothetical protein
MIRLAACQVRRSRGHAQNVNICTPALMATKYPAVEHKAALRALSIEETGAIGVRSVKLAAGQSSKQARLSSI